MSALSFYSNPKRKRGIPRFPSLTLRVRQPDENNLPVRPIGKKESRRSWRIVRRGLACSMCFSNFDGILSFLRRCECVGLASLLAVASQEAAGGRSLRSRLTWIRADRFEGGQSEDP